MYLLINLANIPVIAEFWYTKVLESYNYRLVCMSRNIPPWLMEMEIAGI